MDLQLNGKLALITGSTLGIGHACAVALNREGARVIINGRSQARIDDAMGRLPHPDTAHGSAADLSTREGVDQLVADAQRLGTVDIVINNFGIFDPQPFEEIPDERWLEFFNLNVLSGVRVSRALIPAMRAQGWGRILFISSESGINIPPEMIHYGMTKTAQLAIARGLAKHLKGTGVTVNSVLPGPTWTEGVEDFVKSIANTTDQDPAQMRDTFVPEHRSGSLIQRFAEPEEVASYVAYLCSPLSSAISGSACRVEGGIVDTCC